MIELGPYANFIIAAYAISALTLMSLTIWVHLSENHHKKTLTFFQDDDE